MPHDSHYMRKDLILNIVHHLGSVSRTGLIDLTGCRPASVSEIIRELLDEKLLIEGGSRSVGHGRRRIMLEMNNSFLCAIAISFYPNAVTYLVSQIDGTVLYEKEDPIGLSHSRADLAEAITKQIAFLLEQFQDRMIVGIGISIPVRDPFGSLACHTLLGNYAHFSDWIRLELKPHLEHTFDLFVGTYNGVTLPAVAEHRFGVAKGIQNFICIELSNGIGASIFSNGMPVTGYRGFAGELGHTVIHSGDSPQPLCYCGKPGCVEATTSFSYLSKQLTDALDRNVFSALGDQYEPGTPLSVEAIRAALDSGDQMSRYYVGQIAQRLGIAIANAINLLNPELIVLHGMMLELGDYFLDALTRAIHENVLSIMDTFEIRTSFSTEALRPLGAVAEVFSSYLHSDDYKWVYTLQSGDLDDGNEEDDPA